MLHRVFVKDRNIPLTWGKRTIDNVLITGDILLYKNEEDVEMSKPKTYANKFEMVLAQEVNIEPKTKQTTSI